MKRGKILLFILMMGVQTQMSLGQSIQTDKQFYVTNSDKGGTAWVEGLPSHPPKYDSSARYIFDHWAYAWSGAVIGNLRKSRVQVNLASISTAEADKPVSVTVKPAYKSPDGREVFGAPIAVRNAAFTVCKIRSVTRDHAPDGTADSRKTVGIAEWVDLTVVPDISGHWTTDGHGEFHDDNANPTTWEAPIEDNDAETLTVTFDNGDSGKITFAVIGFGKHDTEDRHRAGTPEGDGYAIGRSGDASAITSAAGQIEKAWPENVGTYSMSYRGLVKGMADQMGQQPDAASVHFLESVVKPLLEKRKSEPFRNCGALWYTQIRGFQVLLKAGRSPGLSKEERLRLAEYGIGFLEAVQKRVIVHYETRLAYANLPPPYPVAGTGLDPQDPAAQTSPEQVARVNEANINMNIEQRTLANVLPDIKMSLNALLKDTGKRYPEAKEQIAAMFARINKSPKSGNK